MDDEFMEWLRDYQRTNKEEHGKHYPSNPFARIVYGRLDAVNVIIQKLEEGRSEESSDDPHDYLDNSGACPVCKSINITADPIESASGAASGDCHCKDCNASWTDYYTLAGYEVHDD